MTGRYASPICSSSSVDVGLPHTDLPVTGSVMQPHSEANATATTTAERTRVMAVLLSPERATRAGASRSAASETTRRGVPAQLPERRGEVARQRRLGADGARAGGVRELDRRGVQRQAFDERRLPPVAPDAVAALERREQDRLASAVERVDRARAAEVLHRQAHLVRAAGL